MPTNLLAGYKSASQMARVSSEAWGEQSLYCASCDASSLERCVPNMKSIDFICEQCKLPYQLKSSTARLHTRVTDGAYATMKKTIESGQAPNLLLLQYDLASWMVRNLTVVPWFAVTLSCLECRPVLMPPARRAGWQGCNILLRNMPPDVRVPMVVDGQARAARDVRRDFAKLTPVAKFSALQRGWTLDVLNVVRGISKKRFSLRDVCNHSPQLQRLHPENRHVEAKIRQQLQILRDMGILNFLDNRGNYEVID